MAHLKAKGDLAEMAIAADLLQKGYKVAFPFGEDWDYDLIVLREGRLERIQVKYATSDGRVVPVRCRSISLTNGKVRETKRYTATMIDWLAVYDATTKGCFYVPASELGEHGRWMMHLRLVPARSGRQKDVHLACDYVSLDSTRGRGANGNTRALHA